MSYFTVRVELHGVSDYTNLHDEMHKLNFFRSIRKPNTDDWYQMPTAEYNLISITISTLEEALKSATVAVKAALAKESTLIQSKNNPPTILIVKSSEEDRLWSGLKKL